MLLLARRSRLQIVIEWMSMSVNNLILLQGFSAGDETNVNELSGSQNCLHLACYIMIVTDCLDEHSRIQVPFEIP